MLNKLSSAHVKNERQQSMDKQVNQGINYAINALHVQCEFGFLTMYEPAATLYEPISAS